jgi:hypothetical protein
MAEVPLTRLALFRTITHTATASHFKIFEALAPIRAVVYASSYAAHHPSDGAAFDDYV